jgi:putative transcriptional regulator
LSTSGDILKAIASGEGPSNYLIALGYSGWNPGQLDEELTENVWIQAPTDFDIIFNTPAKDQVNALSKKIGFDLRMISPDFGNA